ncbi:TPA: restriction endonuclease subunit S [Pseudomonas putida]|uniref:Restriction endonuclease subunit S n=1 Tax=Pseudomonas juntendi TaxID=2666183 RepID=A0ABZ2JKG2_9PSED|nr:MULTISPECIES: restriction endonuclease subunit S [Bacteria]MCE0781508.1 restriction endonuclease subunit S [Pseudomonas sp. NMI542_15]MCE0962553.1 restriction endonuclease subunit S [Pseudomonas putida]MCE0990684.1 restriction endonuclease subunit S [Pseudomonas alloputida]WKF85551.1 restriction endonuclease subunit S [Lacticaseibacillus pantheris]
MSVEITPGYKQTELGIVPEDWQIQSLPEALQFISGKAHEQFINEAGPYVVVNSKFISTEGGVRKYSSENFCPAKRGDVLMVMSDLPNGRALAKCYLVKEDKTYAVNQRVCIFRPVKGSSEYFYYLLNRNNYFMQFDDGVQQTHLLNPMILNCQLKVPPEPEQYRIGQALADIDSLISSLDQLITKKSGIQQAAMQQLLTGQRRLPGFSGEWPMMRLGGHMTFLNNGTNSRAELSTEGDIHYLHYGDIHGSQHLLLNPAITSMPCLSREKAKRLDRLQNGDLVFADASEDLDSVGKSVEIQLPENMQLVSGLHTIAVRFDKKIIADGFKAYLQFIPTFRSHLRQLAAGTKVYATNRAHIASAELKIPGTEEQAAIANILADMGTELAVLEARRNKARQLKQGMMQELLTGRIRLL